VLIRTASAIAEKTNAADMADEILHVMVQNAGATRGVLLLVDDGALRPAASHPVAGAQDHPESMVNLVHRSGESLILADARNSADFAQDPYFLQALPQSVLCASLVARGVVIGVTYLENAHLRGVFTPDRAHLVEVLGAQSVIALENVRLLS
jgi:histidine kinase